MTTAHRIRPSDLKCDVPEGRVGPWAVEKFSIDEDAARSYNLGLIFSGNGRMSVRPGDYTRLRRDGAFDPMMSDTPMELNGLMPFVAAVDRYASPGGRVLIHGLGLGIAVKAALMFTTVEHIDVVEIDPNVIALVGPHYDDPRLHLIAGDALTYRFPRGTRWNVVWHDIWPEICGDNSETMGTLNRRYGRRCVWQGAWEQAEVRRQNRKTSWW